jgi:MFS family permease
MDRSLVAVLAGTFTLRFSTGLTGAMLGFYLASLADAGHPVDAIVVGVFSATFYLAELLLSPVFGILSDRIGHHRVMLYGPMFGAVAVIMTGLTTNLVILGGTRWLEGASTAASVPSILGYIAMVTAKDEALRGKAAARFEGATLAGLGVGFAVAPLLFEALGASAFFLNAVIYGVSYLIYWRGVDDPAGERETLSAPHFGWRRYTALLTTSHVWLLAPTWIAVNASIGLWFSQSVFQFAKENPAFPDQSLMRGFTAVEITIAAVVIGLLFGAGLWYWGNRFKNLRRTTIILYGILGGAVLVAAGLVINHGSGLPPLVLAGAALVAAFGLFVLAGATPAALGLLADISERFPADRGAIMGLYSVFLGLGQIAGALLGGVVATWRGIDGLLLGTMALLLLALLPLAQLRRHEHYVGGTTTPAYLDGDAAETDDPAGP